MNAPSIPISWGELIDKITILEIKSDRITSNSALANVHRELALLSAVAEPVAANTEIRSLTSNLKAINAALWDVEDRIREKEKAKAFDHDFVRLARSVLENNDARAAIKRQINDALSSELIEEKSYKR
jgi:hypothetical protein